MTTERERGSGEVEPDRVAEYMRYYEEEREGVSTGVEIGTAFVCGVVVGKKVGNVERNRRAWSALTIFALVSSMAFAIAAIGPGAAYRARYKTMPQTIREMSTSVQPILHEQATLNLLRQLLIGVDALQREEGKGQQDAVRALDVLKRKISDAPSTTHLVQSRSAEGR